MPKRLIDLSAADALNSGDDLVYIRQASGSRRDRKITTKQLLTESYSDIGGVAAPWDPEDEMPLPVLVWRRAAGVLMHGWLDLTEWLRSRLATVDSSIAAEKLQRELTDNELSLALAAEATARESADTNLDTRVDVLETAMYQVHVPNTGTAALKLYGAMGEASSTEPDVVLGTIYRQFHKVLSLFSTFFVNSTSVVPSTRAVTIQLHDSAFGAWAHMIEPPGGLVRHIPVELLGDPTHQYAFRVTPPVILGGDASLTLMSVSAAGVYSYVSYADLFTRFGGDDPTTPDGVTSDSPFILCFHINFSTVLIPQV